MFRSVGGKFIASPVRTEITPSDNLDKEQYRHRKQYPKRCSSSSSSSSSGFIRNCTEPMLEICMSFGYEMLEFNMHTRRCTIVQPEPLPSIDVRLFRLSFVVPFCLNRWLVSFFAVLDFIHCLSVGPHKQRENTTLLAEHQRRRRTSSRSVDRLAAASVRLLSS